MYQVFTYCGVTLSVVLNNVSGIYILRAKWKTVHISINSKSVSRLGQATSTFYFLIHVESSSRDNQETDLCLVQETASLIVMPLSVGSQPVDCDSQLWSTLAIPTQFQRLHLVRYSHPTIVAYKMELPP